MRMKIHAEKQINAAYDAHQGMEYCYFCMRERLNGRKHLFFGWSLLDR